MLKDVIDPLKHSASQFNVLDDVIDTLRLRGSIFFHSSLAAPWGMSLESREVPRFHIALEGSFFMGAQKKEIRVQPMDIVMLPHGDMHWIADETNRELVPSAQAGEACSLGTPLFQQGQITNRVMCGVVEYDKAINHPILSALPGVFHLSNIKEDDSIWVTVELIDSEITASNSRTNSIIDRLTEVLFIKLINRYVSENEHLSGFFAALGNPRLKKILQLIHEHPEKQWSIEIISEEVGMSRATLQRKFKAELGVSPMTYVSRWRLAKAYQLLNYSSLTLEDIAQNIGFGDARTFRNAFSRHYGFTPSELRKNKVN